jgi:hypothetical protein
MPKMSQLWLALTVVMAGTLSLNAQEAQPSPTPAKRKPITMEMTVPRAIHFFYSGMELKNLEDLKGVISPLNDPEANRLLEDSKNSNSTGVVLISGGGVVVVGGVVIAATDPNFTKQNATIDTQEAIGLGTVLAGLVVVYMGAFKIEDSKADEFNAVQRYNAAILGDGVATWNLPSRTGFHTDLLALKF